MLVPDRNQASEGAVLVISLVLRSESFSRHTWRESRSFARILTHQAGGKEEKKGDEIQIPFHFNQVLSLRLRSKVLSGQEPFNAPVNQRWGRTSPPQSTYNLRASVKSQLPPVHQDQGSFLQLATRRRRLNLGTSTVILYQEFAFFQRLWAS